MMGFTPAEIEKKITSFGPEKNYLAEINHQNWKDFQCLASTSVAQSHRNHSKLKGMRKYLRIRMWFSFLCFSSFSYQQTEHQPWFWWKYSWGSQIPSVMKQQANISSSLSKLLTPLSNSTCVKDWSNLAQRKLCSSALALTQLLWGLRESPPPLCGWHNSYYG